MDNEKWGRKLRAAYEDKTPGPSGIGLPAPNQIAFYGEKDCVKVIMKEEAVVANMQTNAAAFEAWSLALRVWCGVETVELNWDRPSDISPTEQCHYQRFLFRAERFRVLCADWFRIADPALLSDAEALRDDGEFFLNVPGDRSQFDELSTTDGTDDEERESYTEERLQRSASFQQRFELEKIDRQLPVGLFRERVANEKRIFPGGKSAIDLVGIGRRAFWLFELKTGGNVPAGILSELLFYASVIRDAIPAPARFQFDPTQTSPGRGVSPGDILRCTSINGVLLGDDFHPLIGHRDIIDLLNKAAAEHWNGEQGRVPVRFRAVLLKRSTNPAGEFAFEDVAP